MAEDMHVKVFVKSKVGRDAGRYVNAMSVMATFSTSVSPDNDDFKDPFNYSSQDVFAVFGSPNGQWAKLKCLKPGFPDWLMAEHPTEAARLKMKSKNYYGFSWATLSELKSAISDYSNSLRDIREYYKKYEDPDAFKPLNDIISRDGCKGPFFSQWNSTARDIQEKLSEVYNNLCGIEKHYSTPEFRELIDVEDTVFIYWFDS